MKLGEARSRWKTFANCISIGALCCFTGGATASEGYEGFTSGTYSISATGGLLYSVRIRTPKGAEGIEPQIALSYNSQNGNGLLGVGWRIDGLSAITVCEKTIADDGIRKPIEYTADSAYCLDGKKLKRTDSGSGAQRSYKLIADPLFKVIGNASPGPMVSSFKVWDKNGLEMTYGPIGTTAGITLPGIAGRHRAWLLSEIKDKSGNYMSVVYGQSSAGVEPNSSGDYYPTAIRYGNINTENSNAAEISKKIFFEYDELRPDIFVGYQWRSPVSRKARLVKIRSEVDGRLFSSYSISYETSKTTGRSQIANILECFEVNCKGALRPKYAITSRTINSTKVLNQSDVFRGPLDGRYLAGDFNGDGIGDVLHLWKDAEYAASKLYLGNVKAKYPNTSGGLDAATAANISGMTLSSSHSGRQQQGVKTYTHSPYISFTNSPIMTVVEYFSADFTGDGLPDVLRVVGDVFGDAGPGTIKNVKTVLSMWRNTGSGFAVTPNFASTGSYAPTWYANGVPKTNGGRTAFVVLDINGDGRMDFAHFSLPCLSSARCNATSASDYGPIKLFYYLSNGSTLDSTGSMDVVHPPNFMSAKFLKGDFNGDGNDDIAEIADAGGNTQINVFGSNGSGFSKATWWSPMPGSGFPGEYVVGDFNADGLSDIAQIWNHGGSSSVIMYQSDGSKFVQAPGWGNQLSPYTNQLYAGDLDGDGVTDIASVLNSNGATSINGWLARGNRFENQGLATAPPAPYPNHILPGAHMGNGRLSFLNVRNENSNLSVELLGNIGRAADLATGFSYPLFGVSYNYLPQLLGTRYSQEMVTTYPRMVIPVAMPVVTFSSESIPTGGDNKLNEIHSYDSALVERGSAGRGFIGFNWTQKRRNSAPETEVRTYRSLTWPYIGLPTLVSEYALPATWSAGALSTAGYVKSTSTEYSCLNILSNSPCVAATMNAQNTLPIVYAGKVISRGQEIDGTSTPAVEQTINSVDSYGNPLVMSEVIYKPGLGSTLSGYGKTTTTVYGNSEDPWLIGKRLRVTIKSTQPDPEQ